MLRRIGIAASHGIGQRGGAPAGAIVSFAAASAPDGWLLCQGQEVSTTTYADLYAVVGTTYGSLTNGSGGAGTSHFRLPDFRGRTAVGSGTLKGDGTTGTGNNTGSSGAAYARGDWGGVETVTLTSAQSPLPAHGHSTSVTSHGHTTTLDNHSHAFRWADGTGSGNGAASYWAAFDFANYNDRVPYVTSEDGINASMSAATSGISVQNNSSANAADPHANTQPFITLNYIIKI